MKLNALFLLSFLTLIFLCGCEQKTTSKRGAPEDKFIDMVLSKTIKTIQRRYNVHSNGFGMAAMDEVKKLMLDFEINRKLPKDEIRAIVVDAAHEMVKIVNECEGIKPYLMKEGFNESNVEIILYLSDKGKTIFYPEIATAMFYSGKIEYDFKSPEKEFGFISDERESYDEAIAILREQGRTDVLLEHQLIPDEVESISHFEHNNQ